MIFSGEWEHLCGEISLFGDKWSPLRALSACGQILQKNPGRGQTLPPSWQCLYFASFRTGTPSLNWFQSLGKLISEFLKTECEELRHAITHTMSLLDVRIIRYSLYSISITRLCGQLITPIFIHWEISWQHITNWNFRNKVGLPIMSRENIIIGQLESILRLTCVWWFFFKLKHS